jgi:hypothetical protein
VLNRRHYTVLGPTKNVTSLLPDWKRHNYTNPPFNHPFRHLKTVNDRWIPKRLLININRRKIFPSKPKFIDGEKNTVQARGIRVLVTPPTAIFMGHSPTTPNNLPSVCTSSVSHPEQLIYENTLKCDVEKAVSPGSMDEIIHTKMARARFHIQEACWTFSNACDKSRLFSSS